LFIPDPDPDFLTIPDPGVKKAPDPGSGSATLVTKMRNMDSVLINTAIIFPKRTFRILCRFTGVLYTAITKASHDWTILFRISLLLGNETEVSLICLREYIVVNLLID
jgi:hypothetical protein